MRPDLRSALAPGDALDDDSTAWLVTFSDLCLQLFAFVLVALVVTSARVRVPTPATPVAPPATTDTAVAAADVHEPEDIAALAPPAEPEPEPVAEAEDAGPVADPPSPLAALGRRLEDTLATTGIEGISVTATTAAVIVSLPALATFASGQADLLPDALPLLDRLRPTLQALADYTIDVIGHTDDVPIHTAQFPSNLELSLARAARVAGALAASDPGLRVRTRAAGFGEFRPVASNDDEAGRARNRRVEIQLVPPSAR